MTNKRKNTLEGTDASGHAVRRIVKIGPTHARGLKNLVGLNSAIRQGDATSKMSLDAELSCGKAPIKIRGQEYELALRSCYLSVERENCDVVVGTRYEYWLSEGSYKASSVERETVDRAQNAGVEISAEGDLLTGIAKLAGKLNFGKSRKKQKKEESTTQKDARTELISASGEDRWKVGDHVNGDARRQDGLLSGVYFNEHGNDLRPLCILSTVDEGQVAGVTLSVTASFGSLVVRKDGEVGPKAIIEGAQLALKRRAKESFQEHNDLRARMAGLVLARNIKKAQVKAGYELSGNEFLIVQQSLSVFSSGIDDVEQP